MGEQISHSSGPEISVVIPLYNEHRSLSELHDRISEELSDRYSFEVIFVDDGSSDPSWEVIQKLTEDCENTHGIRFQRNYGKSTALQSGFEKAKGRFVVTMDADLQDDPAEIPDMVEMLKEGYDLVSGWKKEATRPDLENDTL
ncbi:MAG: glycosyltransferase family 2 protein [Balneolaceae bacterium]|nr:glycosyltransferase family 2 protein [Balneolaceae bacterium]